MARTKAQPAARLGVAAQPALEPGHYRLAEIGEVVAKLKAKGYTVQGMVWDNKMGVPRLMVERPSETVQS